MSLRIAVRVRPGAKRTAVGGSYPGPYGPALVIAVRAPAVDGRANTAAIRAFAEACDLRPRDVRVAVGRTGRDKLLEVRVDSAELAARVAGLRGSPGPS